MELAIFILFLIVLDLAAWRWGTDSTENIDSCEWERRQTHHRAN